MSHRQPSPMSTLVSRRRVRFVHTAPIHLRARTYVLNLLSPLPCVRMIKCSANKINTESGERRMAVGDRVVHTYEIYRRPCVGDANIARCCVFAKLTLVTRYPRWTPADNLRHLTNVHTPLRSPCFVRRHIWFCSEPALDDDSGRLTTDVSLLHSAPSMMVCGYLTSIYGGGYTDESPSNAAV